MNKEKKRNILMDDMDVIAQKDSLLDAFSNQTILITGATGLIGSLVVKAILYSNKKRSFNIKVIAVVRDLNKAKTIFSEWNHNQNLEYIVADLATQRLNINEKIEYIIHGANVTNSKTMVTQPVETIQTALRGTETILNLAIQKKCKGVVYLSSMEVYGQCNTNTMVKEQSLGEIDLSCVRSCYPESKRMCECLCNCYAAEYGVKVKSARLAQTFGAGIMPTENRVFAQFAKSVIKEENIVLHTRGESEGNYVYTRDAVIALLMLLQNGENGEAYNITNEKNHITIAKMAEMVANEFGHGKSRVIYDIPNNNLLYGYAPDTKLYMSSEKMSQLGWKPEVGLKEAYQRMITYMYYEWL